MADSINESGDPTNEADKTETVDQDKAVQSVDNSTSEDNKVPSQSESKPDDQSANKSVLADLHKERSQRKDLQAKVTNLEASLAEFESAQEKLTAATAKYDRLEAFLLASDSPISKTLDSRSFTERLFNSEDEITDIIADWKSANPTATSAALSSDGSKGSGKMSMNDLLHAARS